MKMRLSLSSGKLALVMRAFVITFLTQVSKRNLLKVIFPDQQGYSSRRDSTKIPTLSRSGL